MRTPIRFLVSLAFLSSSLCWADPISPIGTIETIEPSGAVSVRDAQGAVATRNIGADLFVSEHVLPSTSQTVTLHLKDDSYVTAAPGSDVSVTDYVPGQADSVPHVKIDKGFAHFDVNKTPSQHPTFYIRTGSATMGVRGTEFLVEQRNDGYTTVHTLDGTVSMGKTEADLDDPSKSVNVPANKTSYMHSSMTKASTPRIFNKKTYLSQLGKNYPGMAKQVEQSGQRRQQRSQSSNSKKKRLQQMRRAQELKKSAPPRRLPRKRKSQ